MYLNVVFVRDGGLFNDDNHFDFMHLSSWFLLISRFYLPTLRAPEIVGDS